MDFETHLIKLDSIFAPSSSLKIDRKNSASSMKKSKPKSQMETAYRE